MRITTLTMNNTLTAYFEDVDFPLDARDFLVSTLEKLCENSDFIGLVETYEKDMMNQKLFVDTCDKISEKTNVHEYTVKLISFICFTKRLKEKYQNLDIDKEIYINTVSDLKYKAVESMEVKNVWGVFCADWLYKYFEPSRFALGRLQFEIIPFGVQYKDLMPDTPCLKFHIPRNGLPLTPESIDSALERAKIFFSGKFSGRIPVICGSYLLYEETKHLFKEGSNLRKFYDRFEIVSNTPDNVGEYPNMWRLFDMDYTGNPDDYPEDSSLRRNFKQYIKNGGRTGVGLGVFFI